MNQLKLLSGSILLATLLSACGGSSSSPTASTNTDGTCTGDMVNAHNQLVLDMKGYRASPDADHLQGFQNSCFAFKNLIGGGSCTATNMTTHEITTESYDGPLKNTCELVLGNVPDSNSPADGSCSEEVIASFNTLISTMKDLQGNSDDAHFRKTKEVCLDFKNKIGSQTCNSTNSVTQKKTPLSYSGKIGTVCEGFINR